MKNENVAEISEMLNNCIATIDRMNEKMDGIIEMLDLLKEEIVDTNKKAESILLYGPK